nr:hypothetical protein [Candidatus Krumholzibacteria bacterium]
HRFVFFHVAPFSHNSKVGACESVRAWGPMMEELGVDVVFSGHSHAYEHYRYGAGGPGHTWPSPGGMHFVVTGRSGGYEHQPDEDFDCFADSFCIKSIYTHNYVYAAISATDCISVAVRDAEGRILDFFLIED